MPAAQARELEAIRAATIVVAAAVALACGSPSGPRVDTNPTPDAATILRNLSIDGDPESATGARWTYHEVAGGTTYDLAGILLKPAGAGPFPGVIVSHGAGGNATIYSRSVGSVMRGWGLVVIGVNYTHSGGVAIGSPGSAADQGASTANVLRARKTVEILGALPYIDPKRIAAHGHSMGAFVTSALLGAHPSLILVASHTAGGVRPANSPSGPAPDDGQVSNLRTPYQLHHGDADVVVGLAADQRLASLLSARGVDHDLIVYPGASHSDVAQSDAMFTRVREWYRAHGLMTQ
jgi:dienelactone hydrolase